MRCRSLGHSQSTSAVQIGANHVIRGLRSVATGACCMMLDCHEALTLTAVLLARMLLSKISLTLQTTQSCIVHRVLQRPYQFWQMLMCCTPICCPGHRACSLSCYSIAASATACLSSRCWLLCPICVLHFPAGCSAPSVFCTFQCQLQIVRKSQCESVLTPLAFLTGHSPYRYFWLTVGLLVWYS